MKRLKKITSALAVVALAVAFAAFATYVTTPEEDRADLFDSLVGHEGGIIERQIGWDALPAEVVAWMEIPGTSIDSPIAQATPDTPSAYLYRDALNQGSCGTPYIDCECSLGTPFVIIYGHHMSDGSAFADFANFIDEGYAREHDEIVVYKRGGEAVRLRPVAVDVVNASRETLVIDHSLAPAERIASADLVLEEEVEADQLFAFATCSYQTSNSRTIVYAVCVG